MIVSVMITALIIAIWGSKYFSIAAEVQEQWKACPTGYGLSPNGGADKVETMEIDIND